MYIAMSADLSRLSMLSPASRKGTAPMLAVQ
jgi:hypothetical protein